MLGRSGSPRLANLLALLGLAAIAAFYPDARKVALLVAALVSGFWLMAVRADERSGRAVARGRRASLWPEAGVKHVVDALREPAMVVDRGLSLRFRNSASEPAFGPMTLGDPIALRFRAPEFLAAVEEGVRENRRADVELRAGRPADRFWSVDVLPIVTAQSEPPDFFMLLFRDRTAELRIERMRTDFVANASHELRTPLASLMGFIETLQGPARNDAAARTRFLDIMAEQATRMSRLIDDLLSLSRIEMKRRLRADERADLVSVLQSVRELMEPVAAEKGVQLVLERPAEASAPVNGEHDELVQVFSNLVENACKYASDGKRVVLGIRAVGEAPRPAVEAFVRDFGPGIAPEHVPRLTERFYRVETSGGRQTRGTGLGLSIVRNILARHNTRLTVDSVLKTGSTFSARFELRMRSG